MRHSDDFDKDKWDMGNMYDEHPFTEEFSLERSYKRNRPDCTDPENAVPSGDNDGPGVIEPE